MHSSMLLLAERLVIAIETMSQDVKNMSAYVYDLSVSVSCLLNDKKENEFISVAACDEGVDIPATSVAKQGASAESEYTEQYEQTNERSSSHISDPENGGNHFVNTASLSVDSHKYVDVLSPDSNPISSGGIKIKDRAEVDVSDDCGDSRNTVGILKEIKSEMLSETEGEDREYGLHTTTSHSVQQSTPSESVSAMDFGAIPIPQGIQRVETSSYSSINSDPTTVVSRLPEGQASRARTCLMEIAKGTLIVNMSVDSEDKPYKCPVCQKSFKLRTSMQIHGRVHTGEKPYKCNFCGKAFIKSGELSRHMRSHTGERPFKCNICGKAVGRRDHLRSHMRSHTGETPYMCNLCGRAFQHRTSLNYHLRTHI